MVSSLSPWGLFQFPAAHNPLRGAQLRCTGHGLAAGIFHAQIVSIVSSIVLMGSVHRMLTIGSRTRANPRDTELPDSPSALRAAPRHSLPPGSSHSLQNNVVPSWLPFTPDMPRIKETHWTG